MLGLIAFVVDAGTVRLQLPALPERLPRIAADRHDLPVEVIALTTRPGGNPAARQRERAEADFVKRFAMALRFGFGTSQEGASVVDWYRQRLSTALAAVPSEHRVNVILRAGIEAQR